MEIGEIIFDEEENLIFTDELFINGDSNTWKTSIMFDPADWN